MEASFKQKLQKQVADAEQYLEKIKAEMYATVGRIAAVKEMLAEDEENVANEPKKEKV